MPDELENAPLDMPSDESAPPAKDEPDTRLAMRKVAPHGGTSDGAPQSQPPPTHWVYLHGFASSPHSHKARFFRQRCTSAGLSLAVPDLNVPSVPDMTMTAMLKTIDETIAGFPEGSTVGIIGSDLGGLLAILTAGKTRSVQRLLLLAPVTKLFRQYHLGLGQTGVRRWKKVGTAEFQHHGIGGKVRVGAQFVADARQYDEGAWRMDTPIAIVHGSRDEVIDPNLSMQYARANKNATLEIVDDDHSLATSCTQIWEWLWRDIRPRR